MKVNIDEEESEEKMNAMPDPRPLRTRRIRRLALAAATILLLALALLSAAMPQRPAEAYPYPEPPPEEPDYSSMAPTLSVNHSSVVVYEGQTARNSGSFDDSVDMDADTVSVSASMGTITQSSTGAKGTWSWSHKTSFVSADQPSQVVITAKDSTGLYKRKVFWLTVKNVPMTNDMFSNAKYAIDAVRGAYGVSDLYGDNRLATMEAGEEQLTYNPPGQDCGWNRRYNSVWFKITNSSGTGYPELLFSTRGSNFDTVLALYEGTSLGNLRQVACSNNNPRSSSGDWSDYLLVEPARLSAGKTYYLQLSGTGGARSGDYRLVTQTSD